MTITIRPARPADAALVTAFVRELAEYENLLHECHTTQAMIEEALFGAQPRVFCDIAEWDGEPAGNAIWFPSFSTFTGRTGLYLEDLFVRPAFRKRGIGKALMLNLAKRCVAEGWTRFEWTVLDWNTPSIAFYESLGADLKKEWIICRVSGPALGRLAEQG
jgi:GNAT superfamily N-acetyltransferase